MGLSKGVVQRTGPLAVQLGALGVVTGLAVAGYKWTLVEVFHWVVVKGVGLHYPPTRLRASLGESAMSRPWILPVVVGVGGLLAIICGRIFRTRGHRFHGADRAIDAYHHDPLSFLVSDGVGDWIGSLATLGFGGSGGPEGPVASIAGATTGWFGKKFGWSRQEGRFALAASVGIAIGALFGAPLAGVVLAQELMVARGFARGSLLRSCWVGTLAFLVYGAFEGYGSVLVPLPNPHVHVGALLGAVVVGVVAALCGSLYAKSLAVSRAWGARFKPPEVVSFVGGLCVGAMGIALPVVLGIGTSWSDVTVVKSIVLSLPLWFLCVVPFARILGTALTIGSGGTAGLFGPALLIGGFSGAALWRLALIGHVVSHSSSPLAWVLGGMAVCLGSVGRIPLAALLLVVEMTGVGSVIFPVALAVLIGTGVAHLAGQWLFLAQVSGEGEGGAVRLGDPQTGDR